MVEVTSDLQVPVRVTQMPEKKRCDVYIPDLNMTIHGTTYTNAMAEAVLKMTAYYYYCKDRNHELTFSNTYESVADMCDDTDFVTFIGIY